MGKTNPIQTQYKPNQTQSNPISQKAKMNVSYIITKGYENKPHFWTKSKQTQYKPKQTQFQRQKMLLYLTIPYYNGNNSTIELLQRYNDMSAACSRCQILVLGIGNILLRDEGVGVRVIEQMQKMRLPDDVELIDGGTAGADLLDVLAERRKVIVIDAVQADCEPGVVLRFSADDLTRPNGVGMSLHELGLGEALAMTRHLGCAPEDVVVFGIKPRDISCGLELSEEIAGTVSKVVELVLAEIANARRHPFRE